MKIAKTFKGGGKVLRLLHRESTGIRKPWRLRWQPVCANTELVLSNWLKEEPWRRLQPRAVLADRQNFGTGQFGRSWLSPVGGVWISAAIPWQTSKHSPPILGLTVAVALAERLETYGVPVRIKWPNDLYVYGRKLAGILPRLVHRGNQLMLSRIGLGLNVCNRTPIGGIRLLDLIRPSKCDEIIWSAEVIRAFDRAIILSDSPDWVCSEVERRLWSRQIIDPVSGDYLQIVGIEKDGSMKLKRGSEILTWTRFS